MKKVIANAFSLNMISPPCGARFNEVSPADVPEEAVSAVGHESTARVLSAMLGRDVPVNRIALSLGIGDVLYVATLFQGGKPFRPPEGVVLDEAALSRLEIKIIRVEVVA